ncbi:MAG TPA: thioredoxin family protein [Solimonas sp.]
MIAVPRLGCLLLCSALALTGCGERSPPAAAPETPVVAPIPVAAPTPPQNLEAALALAQARSAPVLIDFHAPWCYSCYYMASHVLTGAEWTQVLQRSVVLAVDADAPEGAALKTRYGIKALPSYLVLDAQGQELGRILGEQTRADFYARLDEILARGSALDALSAEVVDASAASIAAGREVLRAWHARYDARGGLAWLSQLPAPARTALQADPVAALTISRLSLLQAAQAQDVPAVLAQGRAVLTGEAADGLGCERAYELSRVLDVAGERAEARALLTAQRAPMERLLLQGVFEGAACADQRSVVLVTADLYAALGEEAAETALLKRAIADAERRIGGATVEAYRRDRNLADNLRIYRDRLSERSGDYAAFDALLPKLIAAYPDDYVYASRYGRSLLARGRAAEALPYLEQSAAQAYGLNRLVVSQARVKALLALERRDEARRVVAETLKTNGPWFPEEAEKLKALLAG